MQLIAAKQQSGSCQRQPHQPVPRADDAWCARGHGLSCTEHTQLCQNARQKHACVTQHAPRPPQHSRANLASSENGTNQGGAWACKGSARPPAHFQLEKQQAQLQRATEESGPPKETPVSPPVSGGECGLGVARTDYPWWKAAVGGQWWGQQLQPRNHLSTTYTLQQAVNTAPCMALPWRCNKAGDHWTCACNTPNARCSAENHDTSAAPRAGNSQRRLTAHGLALHDQASSGNITADGHQLRLQGRHAARALHVGTGGIQQCERRGRHRCHIRCASQGPHTCALNRSALSRNAHVTPISTRAHMALA